MVFYFFNYKGNNRECPEFLKLPYLNDNKFTSKKVMKINKPNEINVDKIIYDKVNKFTKKQNITFSKNIKTEESENQEINYNNFIRPSVNTNQASCLKNMNDYNITENYNLNEERLVKVKIKNKNDYDVVLNNKRNFFPVDVKIDKWPKFYEK